MAARAANTHRAYGWDLRDFETWGGRIPSTSDEIARYLAARAQTLKPSSLRRRLAALASVHSDRGVIDPTKNVLVRRVMQGIERKHGDAPRQVAPLLVEDLAKIIAIMGDTLPDLRDRALMVVGFFGALRRSELAALKREDAEYGPAGVTLHINKSKTNQTARGERVHLCLMNGPLDPGQVLRAWLSASNIVSGAIFPGADSKACLNDRAIARVVKKWAAAIGLNPNNYSGHSLRAGYATSAATAGSDPILIARQTRHKSLQTLAAYVRSNVTGFRL
ncbi:MAG: site-specific integrase [Chloroflexia bacterium]